MRTARPRTGFTLIEVIVAVAIMALVAALAYRGLASMLDARARITAENQKLRDLGLVMARLTADFNATVDRPIRDSYGVEKAAFLGAPSGLEEAGAAVVFTRMGAPSQSGKLADMQRLGYRVKDRRLELLTWPALDQPPRAAPSASTLLENVGKLELRFLDAQNKWQTQWPQLAQSGEPPQNLPRAVQFNLSLADGATYTRVIALP